MAAKALLDENPNPTTEEVKLAMDGHLCRCTGYNMIVEAILAAAQKLQQEAK
jgi:carbon-monoxide dehydrogenase small subunit